MVYLSGAGWFSTLLALGALGMAAWSDWRHGKIYNRLVVRTLAVALAWQALLGVAAAAGLPWAHVPSLAGHYGAVLLNATIGLVVAVGMWIEQVWAAGDAKIFSAVLLLLPLEVYGVPRVPYFPAVTLLLNIFFALFFFLLAEWVVRSVQRRLSPSPPQPKEAADVQEKSLKERVIDVGLAFAAFFFTLVMIRVLRRALQEDLHHFLAMADSAALLLVFVATHWISGQMRKRRWLLYTMIAGTVIGLAEEILSTGRLADWKSLVAFNAFGLMVLAVHFLYIRDMRVLEEVLVDPSELRPHMILSWRQLKRLDEDKSFNEKAFGKVGIEGLTPEQVAALQKHYGPEGANQKVGIARTLPFAPLLFAGLLITLLGGGLAVRGILS